MYEQKDIYQDHEDTLDDELLYEDASSLVCRIACLKCCENKCSCIKVLGNMQSSPLETEKIKHIFFLTLHLDKTHLRS